MREYINNNRWIVSALVSSNLFWILMYYAVAAPEGLSAVFLGIAKFLVIGLLLGGFAVATKLALDIFLGE